MLRLAPDGSSAEPSKTHFQFTSSYHSTIHLTPNRRSTLSFLQKARSGQEMRGNGGRSSDKLQPNLSKMPAETDISLQSETYVQAQGNEIKALHNTKSLLLQLPLELKTLIYELVCGGQVIHIKKTKSGLAHSLCSAKDSEEGAQTKFDYSDAWYNDYNTANRHGYNLAYRLPCFCCDSPWSLGNTVNIGVLSCCRQTYLESRSVLYYTNTFSFDSATVLRQFCLKTPRQSLDIIRSVHVDVAICINRHYLRGTWEWEKGFETITSSLQGLKRLHVGIEHRYDRNEWNNPYALPAQEMLLRSILQAGKLDLAVATVILWDDHKMSEWSSSRISRYRKSQWTLEQKQEWSRYVRRALVHYEDQASDLASVKRKALEEGRICRL